MNIIRYDNLNFVLRLRYLYGYLGEKRVLTKDQLEKRR
jgi:hypothetical protein